MVQPTYTVTGFPLFDAKVRRTATPYRIVVDASHVLQGVTSNGQTAVVIAGLPVTYTGTVDLVTLTNLSVTSTDPNIRLVSSADTIHFEFDYTPPEDGHARGSISISSPDFNATTLRRDSVLYSWSFDYGLNPLRQRQRQDGLAISAPRGFTRNRPKSKQESTRAGWSGTYLHHRPFAPGGTA